MCPVVTLLLGVAGGWVGSWLTHRQQSARERQADARTLRNLRRDRLEGAYRTLLDAAYQLRAAMSQQYEALLETPPRVILEPVVEAEALNEREYTKAHLATVMDHDVQAIRDLYDVVAGLYLAFREIYGEGSAARAQRPALGQILSVMKERVNDLEAAVQRDMAERWRAV
ncbi:MAG TPA: hypothetical protein VHN78_00695 [Chloroflexota bacterium]|nr:hypothetical protein [Chloroflexota bacterium]